MIKRNRKSLKVESINSKMLNELRLFKGNINEDEEEEASADEMLDDIADDELEGDEEPQQDDEEMLDDFDDQGMKDEMEPSVESDDEVEIDVSKIVDGIETNNSNLKAINSKVEMLTQSFNDYMEELSDKNQRIANEMKNSFKEFGHRLDIELKKRMPTEDEKFDALTRETPTANSSLNSFFGISFDEKKGQNYEVNNNDSDGEQTHYDEQNREYVIRQKDVDDMSNDIEARHNRMNNTNYAELYNNMLKINNRRRIN